MSLSLIISQGWDGFELETDCSLPLEALKQDVEDKSDVGRIIDDSKSCLVTLHSM